MPVRWRGKEDICKVFSISNLLTKVIATFRDCSAVKKTERKFMTVKIYSENIECRFMTELIS